MSGPVLRAPFPWYGGKSLAAPLIWRAFGNVPNYVEPFAGSLAVLLARPHAAKIETANDKDGFIANVWRAIASAPDEVAHWADWPVNEADLHARHQWLVAQGAILLERLIADPEYSDPKIAGWWIWGISAWIGSGWCLSDRKSSQLPRVGGTGQGVHGRALRKDLDGAFGRIAERLRDVRVCCGDWSRVLGRSTIGIAAPHRMTPCGVLLDPPYAHDDHEKRLYREDDAGLSAAVRAWALENGDNPALRIALCGLDTEHGDKMPASWTCVALHSQGSRRSATLERIWFSPHCLRDGRQAELLLGVT